MTLANRLYRLAVVLEFCGILTVVASVFAWVRYPGAWVGAAMVLVGLACAFVSVCLAVRDRRS